MGYYPATIVRLSRTFGFARPEEEGAQDVFIPGKFLQGAMTKDRVLIGNIPPGAASRRAKSWRSWKRQTAS